MKNFFFLILSFFPALIFAQKLQVYVLNDYSENPAEPLGFTSLSESYINCDDPDSLSIPDVEQMGIENAGRFVLKDKYRLNFLSRVNISESDTVFIYDYSKGLLARIPVKQLDLVARLSPYVSEEEWPYSQYEYMIGFEVKKIMIRNLSAESELLVAAGREDPFVKEKLKPVKWKKVKSVSESITVAHPYNEGQLLEFTTGDKYTFESDGYSYTVQELLRTDQYARQLIVKEISTGKTVCEKIFVESEGSSAAPLNGINPDYGKEVFQWTGKLFKNKPPVILGFEFLSFGCPEITFLDPSEAPIYINCDNRH